MGINSNTYDSDKYAVVTRQWMGLMKDQGGFGPISTGGYSISSSGTTNTYVARWYPRGPINIHNVGYIVQTALGGASRTRQLLRFRTNNGNDTIADIKPTTTTVAAYTMASAGEANLTTNYCTAGSYISIFGRPVKANAANTLSGNTVTGTVAVFIDWSPKFNANIK